MRRWRFNSQGDFRFDWQHSVPTLSVMDYFVPDSGDGNIRSYEAEWFGKTLSLKVPTKSQGEAKTLSGEAIVRWFRDIVS